MQFLNYNKVRLAKAAASAAASDVESDAVDMAHMEQVTFLATIATANAGNYMTVQQSATSGFESAETLEDAKAIAAEDGDVVAVNVFRPLKRYVRAVIDRGGTNTATGQIYVIQSGARTVPVDNNEDDEIVSTIVVSPAEAE